MIWVFDYYYAQQACFWNIDLYVNIAPNASGGGASAPTPAAAPAPVADAVYFSYFVLSTYYYYYFYYYFVYKLGKITSSII